MSKPLFLLLLLALNPCLVPAQESDQRLLPEPSQIFNSSAPFPAGGRVQLDLVVTDRAGKPVTGLKSENFTLLDGGEPREPVSFQGFNGGDQSPESSAQIILVIDSVNLSGLQVAVAEREAEKFLRRNNGLLDQDVSIYRLTNNGLFASDHSSRNGNDLALEVASGKEPRVVRAEPIRVIHPYLSADLFSLDALGAIVLEQRKKPGRKLVIWLGPGWPVVANGINSFDWATEFSTRMREARVVLFSATEWPSADAGFVYQDFVKGVKAKGAVAPEDFALPVIAVQSGGRVLQVKNDLAGAISEFAAEANTFYRVTFDPPRTDQVDEYHDLRVTVDHPGLTARSNTGYYDEPVFYDQPGPERVPVTLAQLEVKLAEGGHLRDENFAQQLVRLKLTERMSSASLASWKARIKGAKERAALVVLADESAFLPSTPMAPGAIRPTIADQRMMLSRTMDYLGKTIPKLPDFYATRTTFRYTEPERKEDALWKTASGDQRLSLSETSSATVLYRNGRDELDPESAKESKQRKDEDRLDSEGTFGAILTTVLIEAAQSICNGIDGSREPGGFAPSSATRCRKRNRSTLFRSVASTACSG